MHTRYSHTQIGHLMIVVMLLLGLYFGFLLSRVYTEPMMVVIMFLILVLLASFATLTVVVDDMKVSLKFGYGIKRKAFELAKIESVKAVRNHWYYGWGVRIWFWPKMWIYNVSGFDAVELIMKDGRRYRIGTDEPDQLESELNQAMRIHK